MEKYLISVIVPVYNVENYLRTCIESLLEQSYCDFELLLVDDGSTDKSLNICETYALKDSRVKVFHKNNGGVSSARNLGLYHAQGKYICFVDSDDWVKENYLKDLESCMNDDFDFVMSDFIYREDGMERIPIRKAEIGTVEILFKKNSISVCDAPYGKLFKRELINEKCIKFNEKVHYGEDRLFVFTYLLYVEKVCVSSNLNYYYCRRKGSLTSRLYSYNSEMYAYRECYRLISELVKCKGIVDDRLVMNLYSEVCDFGNRVINSIYHKGKLSRTRRLKMMKQIDLKLQGKCMKAGNMKERILKLFLAHHLYGLYDVFRNLKIILK